jgi:hypothetical protein
MLTEFGVLISENDWLQFSRQLPLYFRRAIDREAIQLPHWFLPLSRGIFIAGPLPRDLSARHRPNPIKGVPHI